MESVSLGNLARLLSLRQDTARVRSDVQGLSQELSSGQKNRAQATASGGFAALPALEAALQRMDGYATVISEMRTSFDVAQQALTGIQAVLRDLAPPALLGDNIAQPALVNSAATNARSGFEVLVSRLNVTAGGQSLFAGTATDAPALASGETMLAEIVAAINAVAPTTAADVEAVVDAWFAPGGGFEVSGYIGSAASQNAVAIADGETVSFPQRADADEFRRALASVAIAAVLDEPVLSGFADERAALLQRAGERMLNAEGGVVAVAAGLGAKQAALDSAEARLSAEKLGYDLARSEIVDADPYETATRLKAAEAQLDTIFTITARLSRLSLTEYLR